MYALVRRSQRSQATNDAIESRIGLAVIAAVEAMPVGPAFHEEAGIGFTSQNNAKAASRWESIFASPMATAAAIVRVIHHSIIMEFDVPSYRTDAVQHRARNRSSTGITKESLNKSRWGKRELTMV